MNRQELITLLSANHHSFRNFINGLKDEEFLFSAQQKWTARQQLDHIYRSVKPVALVLSFPRFLIRLFFGKANRPGRTYEDLVKKYLSKLEKGGRATKGFIPQTISLDEKETISKALAKNTKLLCSGIEGFRENDLDTLILPHPLLGKLTI